jgi:hypothetical protein
LDTILILCKKRDGPTLSLRLLFKLLEPLNDGISLRKLAERLEKFTRSTYIISSKQSCDNSLRLELDALESSHGAIPHRVVRKLDDAVSHVLGGQLEKGVQVILVESTVVEPMSSQEIRDLFLACVLVQSE